MHTGVTGLDKAIRPTRDVAMHAERRGAWRILARRGCALAERFTGFRGGDASTRPGGGDGSMTFSEFGESGDQGG